jgi:hypothetical protein
LAGCSSPVTQYDGEAMMRAGAVAHAEPPAITTSLFKSDQAVLDDDAIRQIFSRPVALSQRARVAVMKFPGATGGTQRYYGAYYWRSEDYLKTQQQYIDTLMEDLRKSERIRETILLPSLLTPSDATIPVLREAAVRLQADLLLVYRTTSDIYHRSRLFADDQVKAYCTTEAVLLDVRTGLIPFTAITTREAMVKKERQDADINETMRRAESQAVLDSLTAVADKLTAFLVDAS